MSWKDKPMDPVTACFTLWVYLYAIWKIGGAIYTRFFG